MICSSRASPSQAGLVGIGENVVGQCICIHTIVFGENIALTAAVAFILKLPVCVFHFPGKVAYKGSEWQHSFSGRYT